MIEYKFGRYGLAFTLRSEGSVFNRSVVMATPCFVGSVLISILNQEFRLSEDLDIDNYYKVFAGSTAVLSFLLVFRTSIGYSRFWQGAEKMKSIKSSWVNVASCLFAFCTDKPEKQEEVEKFKHLLVRLMSLMHSCAMHQICNWEMTSFYSISLKGINKQHLDHLAASEDPVTILMQWIQQSIVENQRKGIIDIAPPILSRVFQEIAAGQSDVMAAELLSKFPFPFPYAQIMVFQLVVQLVLTPVIAGLMCPNPLLAGTAGFLLPFYLWSIYFIAGELEMPYGDDANDLPVEQEHHEFDRALTILFDTKTSTVPEFDLPREEFLDLFEDDYFDICAEREKLRLLGEMAGKLLPQASQKLSSIDTSGIVIADVALEQKNLIGNPSPIGDAQADTALESKLDISGGNDDVPPDRKGDSDQPNPVKDTAGSPTAARPSKLNGSMGSGNSPRSAAVDNEAKVKAKRKTATKGNVTKAGADGGGGGG